MSYHNYGLGGVGDESFVVAQQEPDLPESRVITAGPGIQLQDTGVAVTIINTGSSTGGGGGAAVQYVVMAPDPSVVNARVLTPGPFIKITDTTATVVVEATGVVSDTVSAITVNTEAALANSRRLVNSTGISFANNGADLIVTVDSSVTRNSAIQTLTNKTLSQPLIDYQVIAVTSNYTVVSGDNIVLVDASGGPVTVSFSNTLLMTDQQVMVKKIDTSSNTVTLQSADLIDGLSTQVLEQPYEAYTLVSYASSWYVL